MPLSHAVRVGSCAAGFNRTAGAACGNRAVARAVDHVQPGSSCSQPLRRDGAK